MRISDWSSDVCSSDLQSIQSLDWMTEETKQKALAKLATFDPKIGYPKKWKDYSALVVKPDDLVGNAMRSAAVEHARDRQSVVSGRRVSVRVDLGGSRMIIKKKTKQ